MWSGALDIDFIQGSRYATNPDKSESEYIVLGFSIDDGGSQDLPPYPV